MQLLQVQSQVLQLRDLCKLTEYIQVQALVIITEIYANLFEIARRVEFQGLAIVYHIVAEIQLNLF